MQMSGRGSVAPCGGATIALPQTSPCSSWRKAAMRGQTFAAIVPVVAVCMFLAATLFGARAAAGEKSIKEQITGSWRFVSALNTRKDGSSVDRWGPTAVGIFIFDRSGYFSQMITNTDRIFGPRTVSSFGKYSVDEATKTIITKIEGSSTTKMIGVTQRRTILALTENELRYINPVTASGTKVEALWHRLK
jgi:hypothetical protein